MTENNHTPHVSQRALDSIQLNTPLSELDTAIASLLILTTKGDVYSYSTTAARLGVGTNGYALNSDNSETTGNGWQPGPSWFAIIRDEKTSGTDGGGTTSGSYVQRDLNTEVSDTNSIVTIGTNLFTPSVAGTYRIEVSAPGYDCNVHRLQLYNNSTLSVVATGPVFYSNEGQNAQTTATLDTSFTATGAQAYSIKHYAGATKATTGFGQAVGDGAVEVYCEIKLTLISV